MSDMTPAMLQYSIEFNMKWLQEEMDDLKSAQQQIKQLLPELNKRRGWQKAKETIDYLEQKYIPYKLEQIESAKRLIEIRKLQLNGLTYEEAERQLMTSNTEDRQIELQL